MPTRSGPSRGRRFGFSIGGVSFVARIVAVCLLLLVELLGHGQGFSQGFIQSTERARNTRRPSKIDHQQDAAGVTALFVLLATQGGCDGDDDDDDDGLSENDSLENDTKQENADEAPKPQSRLAMLAADWLEEEEEEDALSSYWNTYESNRDAKQQGGPQSDKVASSGGNGDDDDQLLSTEERLDRYLKSRGIDRTDQKAQAQIEAVLNGINSSVTSSSEDVLRLFEKTFDTTVADAVERLEGGGDATLASHKTRRGGLLWLEVAYACRELHNNNDDASSTTGRNYKVETPTNDKDLFCLRICQRLTMDTPHPEIKRKAKALATNQDFRSLRTQSTNAAQPMKDGALWQNLLDPSKWKW